MPTELVTRAQFALMIERAFENYTGKKYDMHLRKHRILISVTMMKKQ